MQILQQMRMTLLEQLPTMLSVKSSDLLTIVFNLPDSSKMEENFNKTKGILLL